MSKKNRSRPGRPLKNRDDVDIPILGVVNQPPDNCFLKLISAYPHEIKEMFAPYSEYKTENITMICEPNSLCLSSSRSETGIDSMSNILVSFNLKNINLYYCQERLILRINRKSVEDAFKGHNAYHKKLTMMVTTIGENRIPRLEMILEDTFGASSNSEFTVTRLHEFSMLNAHERDYAVSFEFTIEYFKSLVNSMLKISNIVIIQKKGNGPIKFISDNVNIKHKHEFNCSESIKIISKLTEEEVVHLAVDLHNIKPFSNGKLGHHSVKFCIHNKAPLALQTKIYVKPQELELGEIKVFINLQDASALNWCEFIKTKDVGDLFQSQDLGAADCNLSSLIFKNL